MSQDVALCHLRCAGPSFAHCRPMGLHALECELRCAVCWHQEYHQFKLRPPPEFKQDLAVVEWRIKCDKYGAHLHSPVPHSQATRVGSRRPVLLCHGISAVGDLGRGILRACLTACVEHGSFRLPRMSWTPGC